MDGSSILIPSLTKTPIDIETLLQWAIAQSGRLPWRGVSDRELMFDHGYTVIPKNCPLEYRGGGTVLTCAVKDDAFVVIEAIKRLEPAIAGRVITCARECIRPDWLPGVVPKKTTRKVYGKRRNGKRRGRPHVVTGWDPCSPEAIRAIRDVYSRWHAALRSLAIALDGQLLNFRIKGFIAPVSPWEAALEESA